MYLTMLIGGQRMDAVRVTTPADLDETPVPDAPAPANLVVPVAVETGAPEPAPADSRPEPVEQITVTDTSATLPAAPGPSAATLEASPVDLPTLWRVTARRLNIRAGPSARHPVFGALAGGDTVWVHGPTDGAWLEVRLGIGGRTGFVSRRYMEPVEIAAN
ncbi:SH3 domain-containing protein [Albidovulum salinarum]|nr:SH3 domain-containing protein [Defluviimonas sp. WL0024]